MNVPRIGVLALQGDVREHLAVLAGLGADAAPVRRPAELADVDGLVLPGGESTTMTKLAVRTGLFGPLRDAVSAGLPAYGTCAGLVLLADRLLDAPPDQPTLGVLDVTVRRNAFGRQAESFESPVPLDGVPGGPVTAVFIRAPWVEQAGPGVEVLGRVGSGPAEGRVVAVRQGDVLATSFHPELTGDTRVHRLFVDLVRERVADPARTLRDRSPAGGGRRPRVAGG